MGHAHSGHHEEWHKKVGPRCVKPSFYWYKRRATTILPLEGFYTWGRTLSWYKSFETVQSCSDLGKILFCSKSKKSKNEFFEIFLQNPRAQTLLYQERVLKILDGRTDSITLARLLY